VCVCVCVCARARAPVCACACVRVCVCVLTVGTWSLDFDNLHVCLLQTSDNVEDSDLVGCYTVSSGKQLPTFRMIVVPPFLTQVI
jgi:hypothetical protein